MTLKYRENCAKLWAALSLANTSAAMREKWRTNTKYQNGKLTCIIGYSKHKWSLKLNYTKYSITLAANSWKYDMKPNTKNARAFILN